MNRRWVAFWDQREPATPLAVTRICVGLVVLLDLLIAKYQGAVPALWSAPPLGLAWGANSDPAPLAKRWLGASPHSAELLWGIAVAAALLMTLGALHRVAGLVLTVALIELARLEPDGDAIDQLLRVVVPILALSRANACLSLDAWFWRKRGKPPPENVPAWPRYLLVLQLLWMYFSAAQNRLDPAWYPHGGFSAISKVLGDPHFARFAPGTLRRIYPLTQLATALTMVFEGSAPLMLLWLWLDPASGELRGGKFGALTRTLHVRWVWMALGASLHVGIIFTMQLGIFPFGMLALYPLLVRAEEYERVAARSL
jgi:hypothetical protein